MDRSKAEDLSYKDNRRFECEICKKKEKDALLVHYKDFNKEHWWYNNLQILCRTCHKSIHRQQRKNDTTH